MSLELVCTSKTNFRLAIPHYYKLKVSMKKVVET